jgi:hypothetical protein
LEFVLYAGQLALPTAILGAATTGLRRRIPFTAIATLFAYGLFQSLMAWHGFEDEPRWHEATGETLRHRPSPGARVGRSIRAAVFHGVWLAAIPRAAVRIVTRRGEVTFANTRHFGTVLAGGHARTGMGDSRGDE